MSRKGTFLLCRDGGHFYLGLTVEEGKTCRARMDADMVAIRVGQIV